MPCKINFGRFQIRTLTETERQMTVQQLAQSLEEKGSRLAFTWELAGPGSQWIRYYYPAEPCIIAANRDGTATKPCLWHPFYNLGGSCVNLKSEGIISHCMVFDSVTDVAVVQLSAKPPLAAVPH
ncbi:MAG: hypothetical protein NT077_02820 [Candidatus Taylorbacteria bacterium]|nr:hypothetical protein [Candidatus Taylorbacteria bacterium]